MVCVLTNLLQGIPDQNDMKRFFVFPVFIFCSIFSFAQQKDEYVGSIRDYQKNYITTHGVVKGNDRKYFRFFPVNANYNISGAFEKITDTTDITMKTSDGKTKHYFKYGRVNFTIAGNACKLFLYQSRDLMKTEKYKDYLFIPFTDSTTGDQSYGSGRYLDFFISDIHNNSLQVDFNKAYNPYCAYTTGFHCPVPPKENNLPVAIKAGEMAFGKIH